MRPTLTSLKPDKSLLKYTLIYYIENSIHNLLKVERLGIITAIVIVSTIINLVINKNVVLAATSSTSVGGNGVYTYGAWAFPYQSYNATNYWVDVVYTPLADTQAPTAPTNLAATTTSESQINLGWTPSTDNNAVIEYEIYRNGTQIATPKIKFYSDKDLASSVTYTYTTIAFDATGNNSTPSAPIFATTNPAESEPVLAPWTPIPVPTTDASGITVSVWGRTYTFNGPFPSQATSQNTPILAGPVQLFGNAGSGENAVNWSTPQISSSYPAKVTLTSTAQLGAYQIQATTTIEYDGLVWATLNFSAASPVMLNSLRLVIPIREDHATFYQLPTARMMWWPTTTQFNAWQGYTFAMNDYTGFQWMSESDQYWHAADPSHALEATPVSNGQAHMIIHMVNDPVTEPAQFKLAFGFMATPAKPRPSNWRGIGTAGTTYRLAHPDKYHNLGLNYAGWSYAPSLILPTNPYHLSPHSYDRNNHYQLNLPFIGGNFMGVRPFSQPNVLIPVWETNKDAWANPAFPADYTPIETYWNTWGTNPAPSLVDHQVTDIETLFREDYNLDGFYFDGIPGQDKSANLAAGFGYRNANGSVSSTYPILQGRDYFKRMNQAIQKYRTYDAYYIFPDAYTQLWMPILSFANAYFEGEILYWGDISQAITTGGVRAGLTDDRLRTLFNQRQNGLVFAFDGRRIWETVTTTDQVRQVISLFLVNDTWHWSNNERAMIQDEISAVTNAIDTSFDITDSSLVYYPYFDSTPVATAGSQTMASVWSNPGLQQSMVVVINDADTDRTLSLHIDVSRLGYATTQLYDIESMSTPPLSLSSTNDAPVTVKARNMRILLLKN